MNHLALPVLQRVFYYFGILFLVALLLYWGQVVLIPVALAILIAFILFPLVVWLEHHHVRRVFGVALVMLVTVSILGVALGGVASEASGLLERLPEYQTNIQKNLEPINRFISNLARLEKLSQPEPNPANSEVPAPAKPPSTRETPLPSEPPPAPASRTPILTHLATLLNPGIRLGADSFLVVVLTFFFLLKPEDLRDRIIQLLGRRSLSSTTKALDEAGARISRYLILQLTTNTIFGVTVWIGMLLLGIPYSFLWAISAVFLRFIPYAGVWLAVLSPVVLSVAQFPGWTQPVLLLGMWALVEGTVAGLVEPLVFSKGTGISAPGVLVAAVIWACAWGPVGLLLSIPLTVCLVVLGEYFPTLAFIHVLLGEKTLPATSIRLYQRLLGRDRDAAISYLETYLKQHSFESAYDEVLLPVLIQAKTDREEGNITVQDEAYVLRETHDLIRRALYYHEQVGLELAEGNNHVLARSNPGARWRVIGCPASDREDLLALEMLRRALVPLECSFVRTSPRRLFQQVRIALREKVPTIVCIAALPPNGDGQACRLGERLHESFPEVIVLVGRWGVQAREGTQKFIRSCGARDVGTTLAETRSQIAAVVAEPPPEPLREELPAGVRAAAAER